MKLLARRCWPDAYDDFIGEPRFESDRTTWKYGEEPFDEVFELFAPLGGVGIEAVVEIGKLAGHFAPKNSIKDAFIIAPR